MHRIFSHQRRTTLAFHCGRFFLFLYNQRSNPRIGIHLSEIYLIKKGSLPLLQARWKSWLHQLKELHTHRAIHNPLMQWENWWRQGLMCLLRTTGGWFPSRFQKKTSLLSSTVSHPDLGHRRQRFFVQCGPTYVDICGGKDQQRLMFRQWGSCRFHPPLCSLQSLCLLIWGQRWASASHKSVSFFDASSELLPLLSLMLCWSSKLCSLSNCALLDVLLRRWAKTSLGQF